MTLTIGQDTKTVSKIKNNLEKINAVFFENAYPNAPFSILTDVQFAAYLSGCCGLFPFFAIPCHMTLLSRHFPFHSPLSTGFFRFLNFPGMIPLPTFQSSLSRAFSVDSPTDGTLIDDNNSFTWVGPMPACSMPINMSIQLIKKLAGC